MPEHRLDVSHIADGRREERDLITGRITVSTTASGSGFSYDGSSFALSLVETSEIGCKEFDGMENFV